MGEIKVRQKMDWRKRTELGFQVKLIEVMKSCCVEKRPERWGLGWDGFTVDSEDNRTGGTMDPTDCFYKPEGKSKDINAGSV